jgi:5'-deoxy-5'-methylthioadenosine phosphorylase
MSYAVIGGSGLYQFAGLDIVEQQKCNTPFGEPSDVITVGKLKGAAGQHSVYFLPRHGSKHHLPPHQVNYRANLFALRELGVKQVLAVNAVGGIASTLQAGDIVIPDQIIDYTYGREHTFSDGRGNIISGEQVHHVDFTQPFDEALRQKIISAARNSNKTAIGNVVEQGVYGCTQGPRLETAAEIRRMAHDGCTLVGMTAMPEAALARELNLAYASISIVANMAAGLSDIPLTVEDIHAVVSQGIARIQLLIKTTVAA